MAKLTSTQIFGDLGVSNIIGCKNLYLDENGTSGTYGLTIGDTTSDTHITLNTDGILVSLTSTTIDYVSAFLNVNNGKQHSIFGAGLNDAVDNYGHIKIGTSGSSDATRIGVIEYSDPTDATTGELQINVPSSNGTLKAIVGSTTAITATEDSLILCGGTGGITFGTSVDAMSVAQDGTISILTDIVSTSNISLSGTMGVGLNTGATSADTRVYFGTNANYIQYDDTALDNGGALQMTKPFNPLKADFTPTEVDVGKDGFGGPQIGWQPEWFDDFTWDTESEYTFSGGYDAGYPTINTNTSVLQLRGGTRAFTIPGAFTGYSFALPLKSNTIYVGRNRYFAIRYRNRTDPGDPPFYNGYVEFTTSDNPTFSASQRVNFELNTATTREWYTVWLDMWDNSNWSKDNSTDYVTGINVYLNDPYSGGLTSGNPQIGIDWLGVGHRGYEEKFNSSDMYYWGDVTIENDLTVSGNVYGIELNDLEDVNTSGVVDGNALIYTGGTWTGGTLTVPHSALTSVQGGSGTTEQYHLNAEEHQNLTGFSYAKTEPTGFLNYKADSTITFTAGTRTIEFTPTGSTFEYMIDGKLYESTGATAVIPDQDGLHYVVFSSDTGELVSYTGWDSHFITHHCAAAYVYWDSINGKATGVGDERHGASMDGKTHEYLHEAFGARYESGFSLFGINADEDGDDDQHAVVGIEAGEFHDEDLEHSVAQTETGATIPVLRLSGTTPLWVREENRIHPLMTGGTGRLVYNDINGGDWTTTEITNNDFMCMHFFGTNEITDPCIAIMGQTDYANLSSARQGAPDEIASLSTVGLPSPEFIAIATVIFQTSNGYANQSKARIRTNDEGADWIDYRTADIVGRSTINDHGSLAGLSDDDHSQYHNDTRASTWLTGNNHTVISATTITGGTVLGVDFSDVANTAHTHDFSIIENTGHTHGYSDITDIETWLTGTNHVVLSATTIKGNAVVDGFIVQSENYMSTNYNLTNAGFSNQFFHDGTAWSGASNSFDIGNQQFNVSHRMNVGGEYIATDGNAGGFDLYLNTNAANTTRVWFGNSDGAYNTHSLSYNTTLNYFDFSHALHTQGTFQSASHIYADDTIGVNYANTSTRSSIYFHNGIGFNGAYLRFNQTTNEFQMNGGTGLDITGAITASTGVYGADFKDIANTAHTHDFSVITNTGHTHTISEITDYTPAAGSSATRVGISLDGGGDVILTGVAGDTHMLNSGTTAAVTLLASPVTGTTGDIEIDIWVSPFSAYPPTVADTIVSATPPTITAGLTYQDTTLTSWTTVIPANSVIRFNVNSVSNLKKCTLIMEVT